MKKLILLLTAGMAISTVQAQGWHEQGVGLAGLNANGQIISIATDNTGKVFTSGAFVLGGSRDVYQWGSTHWETLGSLNANSWFASLYIDGANNVYTAGKFTNSSGKHFVEKWNGTIWLPLGSGTGALGANGTIWTICDDASGNIYASGEFVNGSGNNYVAKWNGSNWSELGAGSGALNANGTIYSICTDAAGNVYAAGNFTNSAGQYYVARWSVASSAWTMLGSAFNGYINRLRCDAVGNVYACGNFTNAAGHSYVAKFSGTAWTEVGAGTGGLNAAGTIYDMSLGRHSIFAAGEFVNSSGKYYVAYWNDTTWSELGATDGPLNANSSIYAVCADTVNNRVYTAGDFTNTGGKYYVAEYDMPVVVPATGGVGIGHIAESTSSGRIFPNPATDEITISVGDTAATTALLTITDAAGRSVVRKTIAVQAGKIGYSLKDLPAGVFVVRAECVGGYTEGQVVKR